MNTFSFLVGKAIGALSHHREHSRLRKIHAKYVSYTMVPETLFISNLQLAELVRNVEGAVVECGVWRGGMIAGVAEVLGPSREYLLCDSFQGLPPAQPIDGAGALTWQANVNGPWYHNNCTADESEARKAMTMSPAINVRFVAGWFDSTLPTLRIDGGIALLRLDGDWYESTMTCLTALLRQVNSGGVVVLDDYYTWDGCARAVHDFLSRNQLALRVAQWDNSVAYLKISQLSCNQANGATTATENGELALASR